MQCSRPSAPEVAGLGRTSSVLGPRGSRPADRQRKRAQKKLPVYNEQNDISAAYSTNMVQFPLQWSGGCIKHCKKDHQLTG